MSYSLQVHHGLLWTHRVCCCFLVPALWPEAGICSLDFRQLASQLRWYIVVLRNLEGCFPCGSQHIREFG
jgi:hypothetical protein